MSGPYPPPGYRPQQPGGWGDGGQARYDFPTVQYGGLATPPGGWGQPQPPPKPPRNTGRLIVAVISVLVIIGGVATAVIVLDDRHHQQAASLPATTLSTPAPSALTTTTGITTTNPDVPNGTTTLTLLKGACVTASATSDNQYQLGHQVTCGTAQSDLVLALVSPAMAGCPDHEYLRVTSPTASVYCFTLDVKKGDCLDNSFLKAPCSAGAFTVLSTEPGPGGSTSCTAQPGATHWVPVGHDPVSVACIGPAKTS